ncbi:hypothetical protein EI42_06389 [Thermosporothrix hazakensis]|jgi:hypothetical protein|uniref:Uncharacterized protein n=1 Tax=Thermosporothrix hazakensis TaxID=644383 RepID=A0A326TNJ7_THEHA|nr:hypothetical protein EI42_06389 [Thermosporothrix hazakensis]
MVLWVLVRLQGTSSRIWLPAYSQNKQRSWISCVLIMQGFCVCEVIEPAFSKVKTCLRRSKETQTWEPLQAAIVEVLETVTAQGACSRVRLLRMSRL